jgi:hypothetical protein
MLMATSPESNFWHFNKIKHKFLTDRDKLELIMMKDIYSLGICIIELMIGRFGHKLFSIQIDSVPLTWAKFRETQPLIYVLTKCIDLNTATVRKGLLKSIIRLLKREYRI